MKKQFTLRVASIIVAAFCAYLALASRYGFGRGLVCAITLMQGLSSIVFFLACYHSVKEENHQNAFAAFVLGLMILTGAMLLGAIVFTATPVQ
jgi:hypothetical protein